MRNCLRVLGSVLLALQLCGAAAAQGPVEFGAPFTLDTSAGSDFRNDFSPQLTTDGQGTWIAVWYSFVTLGGTIGTDADILVARSTDAGVSWTAPAALNTNATSDVGNDFLPQLTTDGHGTWIAVWYSYDSLGGTIGTDRDILVARSTDAGVTWTAPAALNTNAASDLGADRRPQLTTDGQGTWVTVWASRDSLGGTIGTDDDILVARSTDGGVVWTPPVPLNSNAASDIGSDTFPQLTTDGQGNWLAVWGSEDSLGGTIGKDWDILMARSTDAAITWSAPEPLNRNAGRDRAKFKRNCFTPADGSGTDSSTFCAPKFANQDWTPQVTTTTDEQGTTWLAVWVHVDRRFDIRVARSTDRGVTWTQPAGIAASTGNSSFGNFPQLTTDGQGTWLVVWGSKASHGDIGKDDDILMARSMDDGSTWSAPASLNSNARCDSESDFFPQLTADGQGTWLAVWSSFDSLGGTIGTDADILIALPGIDPFGCQTPAQQTCINVLNSDFAKVARAQDKSILRCLKGSARKGESATACLTLPDPGVDKARGKTRADANRRCADDPPDFGPLDADTVSNAAATAELATLSELFGPDLDAALVSEMDDKSAAKCQQAVVKAIHNCQSTQIKEFNRCKKTALKKGGATRPEVLAGCFAADPKGKIAKQCDPLFGRLATKVLPRSCGGVGLAAAFPGCATDDSGELVSCTDEAVACSVCLGLNEADGLAEDCDLFDDGVPNASCQ